jgi:hypothetical protein
MLVIVVQTFKRAGWPDNSTIELEDAPGAAILTAARDFQAETGIDLKGDLVAVPAGGLRPEPWIVEMQWAFDHRHDAGANKAKSLALYVHYNMDEASNARPVLTSPHRYGFCVDIADSRFLAWLIINGHRYGLRRTLVAENDLRHFQFFPGTATAALDVTSLDGGAVAPARRKPMDWTLYWLSYKKRADGTNVYYRGYPGTGVMEDTLFSQDQANRDARRAGMPAIELKSDADMAAEVVVLKTHHAPSPGGSTDLAPVLQAIAALDAQDDTYQATVLKAVNDAAAKGGTPADVIAALKAAL